MTDYTEGPKPWDIEQFRGVRRHVERKKDWEKDADLVLDASHRTAKAAQEAELVLDASYRTGTAAPKLDKDGDRKSTRLNSSH